MTIWKPVPGKTWKQTISVEIARVENCAFVNDCESKGLDGIVRIEKSLDFPSLLRDVAQMDWYHMKEYAFLARLVAARTQSETLCSRCQHTNCDPQLHFFLRVYRVFTKTGVFLGRSS
jgi:hypothetical protein